MARETIGQTDHRLAKNTQRGVKPLGRTTPKTITPPAAEGRNNISGIDNKFNKKKNNG